MKLPEHVDNIRDLTKKAFDKLFSQLGLGAKKAMELDKLPTELHGKRTKIDQLIKSHTDEVGSYLAAREKALDELTFTLFNRIAALKVMEAHRLFPEAITKRSEHGDRSFAHKAWLEENPSGRNEELEGIRAFLKYEFNRLGEEIGLYHSNYPYALLPGAVELNNVLDAFNAVEKDNAIDSNIWQSDDILGWLYESYNNPKKKAHKDSKAKTEYDKVSIQSQVYTPRWVVQFLVDNSLGKLYLEMYPDSEIKEKYTIANAPNSQVRDIKPLTEIKLIDPAMGSGNFLLYAFDLFYDLYMDQVENYGADYEEAEIPRLIIEHNLHGIDLDDRAAQLAQLGLYIKAKRKRLRLPIRQFNVVSSDFYLPEYSEVRAIFDNEEKPLSDDQKGLVQEIWDDLQQAYRFGSLVRVGEKVNQKLEALKSGLKPGKEGMADMFANQEIVNFEIFKADFFLALEKAIAMYAQDNGENFLSAKTQDAITYLKLLTTRYDVATVNPPYTDSSNFGKSLKHFIENNYRTPLRFNSNLYASFIKRCYELTNKNGLIALIHPHTFMFIKSFDDVRKFIIENTHISLLVDLGLDRVNLFGPGILLDATFYILEKRKSANLGVYFNLTNKLQEKFKKGKFLEILKEYIRGNKNERVYTIKQSNFKIIKSYPFIYWISDNFRETFKSKQLDEYYDICNGISSGGNNEQFYRFWWEVNRKEILGKENPKDYKWATINKGGDFRKWYGNLWLVFEWENEGAKLKELKSKAPSIRYSYENYYFEEGLCFSGSSSKGLSVRYQPPYCIFERSGKSIFSKSTEKNYYYLLGLLNSKIIYFITNCLNPTVSLQTGDINRVPFKKPTKETNLLIEKLVKRNINIKKYESSFTIFEILYNKSPISTSNDSNLLSRIKTYFNIENHLITQTLINDAIINEKIFDVYELIPEDRDMVLEKEGKSVGSLPILESIGNSYFNENHNENNFSPIDIQEYISSLPITKFTENRKKSIIKEFSSLYKSNNSLEEFCIRHQINPINIWYWFKESNVLPQQRAHTIAMEFLADLIRTLLKEDDDGIIPLVENAGEEVLYRRIERRFQEKGFSSAQFSSFDSLLGRNINDYINGYFFKDLSDHLNLFMYLPKTPFIWHLTSGEYQGFDCYISIYKWNKDRLFTLKSVYLEKRERALVNKQTDLANDDSAKAQNEKDLIRHQLEELKEFRQKIDELLAEGYNPKLDDGVGKNIAPLQKKGMLAYDVLNAGQLKKYLNADW